MKEVAQLSGLRRARKLWLPVAAAGAALTVLWVSGCGSLSKSKLEEQLTALPKNRPFAEAGLRRTPLAAPAAEDSVDLVYVHLPGPETDAPKPAVVLVHGTPSTLFTWSELAAGVADAPGLAAERDVFAIEVVGHGIAPRPAEPVTFERCALHVSAAIRALGLRRVHLVGQSYGGEFAWRAAANDPELFASLVLMSSSGYERRDGDWLPEEVEMRENSLADLGYLINDRARIRTALSPHFDTVPPGRVDEFFLVCENRSNWVSMVDLARDENGEREEDIASIETPTLVVWGSDDVAYPLEVYGERFARDLPNGELVVLAGAGHYPHEERPAEVAQVLDAFFDRVEAEGATPVSSASATVTSDSSSDSSSNSSANSSSDSNSLTDSTSPPNSDSPPPPVPPLAPGDVEVPSREATPEDLDASGFTLRWVLPTRRATPGPFLPADMQRLTEARFDVRDTDGRRLRTLGDLVTVARPLSDSERKSWLSGLERTAPDLMNTWGRELRELLLDDKLRGGWNPGVAQDRDGLLEAEAWDLKSDGIRPWSTLEVQGTVEQAATLMFADLSAIKAAENDYRRYPDDVGASYEEIYPVDGGYLRGTNGDGSEFAAVDLYFRADLPLWYGDYECRLKSLTTVSRDGRLICDIESTSEDFYWLAGRDTYFPVDTSDGRRVAYLVVRQYGFDLKGVPDRPKDRRKALRASLGNLRRNAESRMSEGSTLDREVRVPPFRVLGRRER